jgi:hypothetical protein
MQRFFDKWGLPAAAVIIGGIILWGLFFAPARKPDENKGPAPGAPAPSNKLE